jgi:hypothetical protein
VIWYKDSLRQNVISINDQLGGLTNATNYEIRGTYNLVIKNVTRKDNGIYTCQLFQQSELSASVNLTVLVPPKFAKIAIKPIRPINIYTVPKSFLVESDRLVLECCTNNDVYPQPAFSWSKIDRDSTSSKSVVIKYSDQFFDRDEYNSIKSIEDNSIDKMYTYLNMISDTGLNTNKTNYRNNQNICNSLILNLTREDNLYNYECSIYNDALPRRSKYSVKDSVSLNIEYKPEVSIHLAGHKVGLNSVNVLENSSVVLICNADAQPKVISYEWSHNDNILIGFRTDTLILSNLETTKAGNYSCQAKNKHGQGSSQFNVNVIYANIRAVNNTSSNKYSNNKVTQLSSSSVHISAYEYSSIVLTCQVSSNPFIDKIVWHYYQTDESNQIINRVILSNWVSSVNSIMNDTVKQSYSQLNLFNITANHTGFYSCSIDFPIRDDLDQMKQIKANATYFLQVQCKCLFIIFWQSSFCYLLDSSLKSKLADNKLFFLFIYYF